MIEIEECDVCSKPSVPTYKFVDSTNYAYWVCPDCLLEAVGEMRDYMAGHEVGCGCAPPSGVPED